MIVAMTPAEPATGVGPVSPSGIESALGDLVARLRDAAARRSPDPSLDALLHELAGRYPVAASSRRDRDGAAEGIAEVYGLDSADLVVLMAAAAPDLDADIAKAVGLLRGAEQPARVSWALALELAGVDAVSSGAPERLGAASRLVRHGLIVVVGDRPRSLRDLVVPERVVDHLLGVDALPPLLAPLVVPSAGLPGIAGTSVVARALEAGERLVWVTSRPGCGGLPLAVAALHEVGVDGLVVDLEPAASDDLGHVVRTAVREAALRRAALVLLDAQRVVGAEQLAGMHAASGAVEALRASSVPVIGVAAEPWDDRLRGPYPVSVEAPALSQDDRVRLWTVWQPGRSTADAEPEGGAGLSGLRLRPEVIPRIADYATRLGHALDAPVDEVVVRRAAREVTSPASLARARRPHPPSFDDLMLPGHVDGQLRRLVHWASVRSDMLADGRLIAPRAKGSGLAALFAGNPGTGKTMAAEVVAHELGVDLLTVDLSSVVDKYIGETEKNLERVFAHAESLDVVLFFDEADALFGKRTDVKDSHDRHANQEVAYLLQRMEVFDGITLLATNLRGNLDAAFSRRMTFILTFPDPDAPTRKRLWRKQLADVAPLDPDDPVDLALLSRIEITGGSIRNAVVAAGYEATVTGSPVGARHLDRAIDWEFEKLSRRRTT